MKNGSIINHQWVYRDWNNTIKQLDVFPNIQFVTKEMVDVYERIVIGRRIKALVDVLNHIKKGLYKNYHVNIYIFDFTWGLLLRYAATGRRKMNLEGIIQRVIFKNGNSQLQRNLLTILREFDEAKMKKFLFFVTGREKSSNFSVVPNYCIKVNFINDLSKLPYSATCFNSLYIPAHQTIDLMRSKLEYSFSNCVSIEKQ